MNTVIRAWFKKQITNSLYYFDKLKAFDLNKKNNFRILLYHSIGRRVEDDILGIRVSREDFFSQMRFLYDNKYNVVRLIDLIKSIQNNAEMPKKSIVITFDDGYKDNLTEAIPILKEFNFPALIFTCLGYIESNKKELDDYWTKWDFLTREDLCHLLNFDIDIGLHSMTHRRLTGLNYNEITEEIINAKTKLESYINKQVNLFSYPHGTFNNAIIDMLKVNGFIGACCSIMGKNDSSVNLYQLKRTEIVRDDTIFEFKKKLNGYYDILSILKFCRK